MNRNKLLKRVNGISIPFIGGGVQWIPPVDEQDRARRLLVFLEDKRVLFAPYEMEIGPYVTRSIDEIRKRLTSDLEEIDKTDSVLAQSLQSMRAACRRFMDRTQRIGDGGRYSHRLEPVVQDSLVELRTLLGIQILKLAYTYELEVGPELETALPPEVDLIEPGQGVD
jgi:hypothetical protein